MASRLDKVLSRIFQKTCNCRLIVILVVTTIVPFVKVQADNAEAEFVERAQLQERLLKSRDPDLAANKRLVYDFWREVFEGLHLDRADRYLTESYLQHNPNVPSGRVGFVTTFSKRGSPKPISTIIQAPLIAIVAEGEFVTLVFEREYDDPKVPGQKYMSTWFDLFRIKNGKIAEHWDPARK